MTHPDLLIRTTRGISDTQDQSKKKVGPKMIFHRCQKKIDLRKTVSDYFFRDFFFDFF